VRSSQIAFGADQLQNSIVTSRYFDKYVVAISIRSIIQTLINVYIRNVSNYYLALNIIGTAMLFVSALLFIIGWRYYIHVKAYDSVVTNCIPVVINAFQSWRQYKKNQRSIKKIHMNLSTSNCIDACHSVTKENMEESISTDERPAIFLDFAKDINHGNFQDRIVHDVKLFGNAIIILILLFPYRLVFNQVKNKN